MQTTPVSQSQVKLTLKERHRAIGALSLPIIGGMISQNIVNLVDTAMVGQVGTTALASVGLGSFLNFFCSALVMGLAVGVQTLCARQRGAKDPFFAIPLNAGLMLSTAISIPLSALLIWQTPSLMAWVTDTPEIASAGGDYLQARLFGMVAMGANFAFRSYWSAVEKTSIYMLVLIVMHIANIVLNWLLIFGNLGFPELGVEGAGYGTAISMWIGVILYTLFALKHALPYGFIRGLPSREVWRELLRMSIPSGVERMFFALGMTVFMSLIGKMGEAELAASNIVLNLFLVAILPAMGFGIASATLVAKSIGAQEILEAPRWRWAVSQWSLITLLMIGTVFWIFSHEVVAIFTDDLLSARFAESSLLLMVVFLPFEAIHMVTYQSLVGLADNRFVMFISLGMQWLVVLPLIYLFGLVLGWGMIWVWGVHFSGRVLQLVLYSLRWRNRLRAQLILSES